MGGAPAVSQGVWGTQELRAHMTFCDPAVLPPGTQTFGGSIAERVSSKDLCMPPAKLHPSVNEAISGFSEEIMETVS